MNAQNPAAPRPRPIPRWLERVGIYDRASLSGLIPLAVLVALVSFVTAVEPSFLETRSLEATAVQASPVLLLALGSTLVILIGGIDLSVAAMCSLCSVLLAKWLPQFGPIVGVLMVLALAAALGGLQGLIHAKTQIPSFVVTLGGLGIFSGAALRISDASSVPVLGNTQVLDWLQEESLGFPNVLLVVVLAFATLAAVMRFTPLGRQIYALGAAEPAARMSGVRATRVRVVAFALSGFFAAVAALLLTSETAFGAPSLANKLLLPTIAAVVVGGTAISGGVGGIGRTFLGGLIVSVVTTGTIVLGFDPATQNIAFGVGVVIAVALTTDRKKIGVIK